MNKINNTEVLRRMSDGSYITKTILFINSNQMEKFIAHFMFQFARIFTTLLHISSKRTVLLTNIDRIISRLHSQEPGRSCFGHVV